MKLFENTESIFEEIEDMEKDEKDRRSDRAIVSGFYNGDPPLSQGEAEELGITVNVNNLFGYTDLAAAKEQTLALYTKPPRIYNVQFHNAPADKKYEWEQKATSLFNRAIKKDNKLKMPYEGVAGDATLHGEGEFFFTDPYTPFPRQLPLSQRLVPSRSTTDPNELSHFAIDTELSIFEIERHLRNESEGWKMEGLRALRAEIFESLDKENLTPRARAQISSNNPEEMEYARQESADVDKIYRHNIPVYYFYQADPTRDGRPLDLTILTKATRLDDKTDNKAVKRQMIFESEEFFPTVTDAIQPFFMDCILGGSPRWHRVKGMGHLNYSLSWHLEMLISRLMQGSMESMMNVWQAADGANREELEKLVMRHNGIIPEHVSLVPNRNNVDFSGMLQVINMFRAAGNRNALSSSLGSTPDSGKELEVQALFRQGQITSQQSSRLSNWYDSLSRLGSTQWARFTCPEVLKTDAHFSDINEFQMGLTRAGIPLYYCQPHNVSITAFKITGDGDQQKAQGAATFFMQNMAMFPAESQQLIKRIVTGIVADDYELAEKLVPIDEKPDTDQEFHADGENNTCILQGRAPGIRAIDVDETHIEIHFKGLGSILNKAAQFQKEAFQPADLMAFKALGGHTIAHIQRMQSMGKKEDSAHAMETMNGLAKMAEKFAHNMEQMQAAQPKEEIDPVDLANIKLKQDQLQLSHEKMAFSQEKFARQQAVKEHTTAMDTALKLHGDKRAEEEHHANLAEKDARLALDASSAIPAYPAK